MKKENINNKLWEEYASVYDALNNFFPYDTLINTITEEVLNLCLIINKENISIVDAGCGTCNLISRMIEIKNLSFTAIDMSAAMLDVASKKLKENSGKVTLINGNIDDDTFWNSLYNKNFTPDIAVLNLVLFNIKDKKRLYDNIYKILNPEGYLVVVDFKPGWRKFYLVMSHLAHKGIISLLKNISSSARIERITKKIFSNIKETYLTEEGHKDLLKNSKFSIQSIEKIYSDQAFLLVGKKYLPIN